MRKKIKGKLYFLARDAKSRMRNFNREKSVFEQLPYAKIGLSEREQSLYERVCRILDSDTIVINPIKELVDNKYYNSLSLEGKQKYIYGALRAGTLHADDTKAHRVGEKLSRRRVHGHRLFVRLSRFDGHPRQLS